MYPVDGLAAAVSDAYPDEAAGHRLGEEGHVAPALQLVSGQTDAVQLVGEGHGLGLGRSVLFATDHRKQRSAFSHRQRPQWCVPIPVLP